MYALLGILVCLLVICHMISDDFISHSTRVLSLFQIILHSHGNSTSKWYARIILGFLQHCAKMCHTHTYKRHWQEQTQFKKENKAPKERDEAERAEPSLIFPASALLTRRPHTWSRCCHASSHLGPVQDRSLWCMGVSHFSQTGGIHCIPPAKIEKVI